MPFDLCPVSQGPVPHDGERDGRRAGDRNHGAHLQEGLHARGRRSESQLFSFLFFLNDVPEVLLVTHDSFSAYMENTAASQALTQALMLMPRWIPVSCQMSC